MSPRHTINPYSQTAIRMNILISNDDGYRAPGIVALYEAFKSLGHVEVVAPELNNSAKSNALTLNSPLYVHQGENGFRYVNGTPADCVHIALTGLLDFRPDLIISGINNGANMGDDTIYSGTVGAAMEGYLMGIPSIAFSQVDKGWAYIDVAAKRARALVDSFIKDGLVQSQSSQSDAHQQSPWLINVNIPNLPMDQQKGYKVCRLGRRHPAEKVITQMNPRGETMYWIGAAGPAKDVSEGTDFFATQEGYTSVTPIQIDLTDYEAMRPWAEKLASKV